MDEIIKQYDSIGPRYIEWQQKFFGEKWDIPLKYIEENAWFFTGAKVLDLWCGDCHDIAYFEEKYDADFHGIDSSEYMISQGRKNTKHPENLFVWTFEVLPFPDDSFDIIYAKYAFSYVENFDRLYSEVVRVLKKWGRFIFVHNHPINDFTKKGGRYSVKETITVSLFSTWAQITYFPHTFSEIISRKFLKNFNIEDVMEDCRYEVYPIPLFMGITATRK